jgi:hypothetical protein
MNRSNFGSRDMTDLPLGVQSCPFELDRVALVQLGGIARITNFATGEIVALPQTHDWRTLTQDMVLYVVGVPAESSSSEHKGLKHERFDVRTVLDKTIEIEDGVQFIMQRKTAIREPLECLQNECKSKGLFIPFTSQFRAASRCGTEVYEFRAPTGGIGIRWPLKYFVDCIGPSRNNFIAESADAWCGFIDSLASQVAFCWEGPRIDGRHLEPSLKSKAWTIDASGQELSLEDLCGGVDLSVSTFGLLALLLKWSCLPHRLNSKWGETQAYTQQNATNLIVGILGKLVPTQGHVSITLNDGCGVDTETCVVPLFRGSSGAMIGSLRIDLTNLAILPIFKKHVSKFLGQSLDLLLTDVLFKLLHGMRTKGSGARKLICGQILAGLLQGLMVLTESMRDASVWTEKTVCQLEPLRSARRYKPKSAQLKAAITRATGYGKKNRLRSAAQLMSAKRLIDETGVEGRDCSDSFLKVERFAALTGMVKAFEDAQNISLCVDGVSCGKFKLLNTIGCNNRQRLVAIAAPQVCPRGKSRHQIKTGLDPEFV